VLGDLVAADGVFAVFVRRGEDVQVVVRVVILIAGGEGGVWGGEDRASEKDGKEGSGCSASELHFDERLCSLVSTTVLCGMDLISTNK